MRVKESDSEITAATQEQEAKETELTDWEDAAADWETLAKGLQLTASATFHRGTKTRGIGFNQLTEEQQTSATLENTRN